MHCVVSLRDDINVLLFVRPAVQMRDQIVRASGQIQTERRAPARLSIHENLGTTRLACNVCERANKCERFIRCLAALHLDVAAHFPVALTRDDRVFAGWEICYDLRRYAVAQNMSIVVPQ